MKEKGEDEILSRRRTRKRLCIQFCPRKNAIVNTRRRRGRLRPARWANGKAQFTSSVLERS